MNASELAGFRDSFSGDVILPGDLGYDAARIVWNAMIDRRPAMIVRPTNTAEVIAAVRFARDHDLIIAVRGGGHSVSGFSTCDGGIVIDLSAMRGARVDPNTTTARVNGGALLGELDDAAQAFGLACPVGVVSHTGVGGLTLGGGMGRLMRKYGLTVDNLLGVEMVTADGRVERVDAERNRELFWGLRGAGANFGIVTAFEFRLHPVGPTITQGFVLHPIERVDAAIELFRVLAEEAPDEVTAALAFGVGAPDDPPELAGRPLVAIGATHCGSAAAAERDLAELRRFGPPVLDTIGVKGYLDVQRMSDESSGWGRRFYMKSGFFRALPSELGTICGDHLTRAPGDCSVSIWSWGRAIGAVGEDETVFTGRSANFWGSAEVVWDDAARDADHVGWGRAFIADLQPFTMGGRYVNDVVETGEDVVRSVYGDTKYERLVKLKRVWDPDNVFRMNQNVRP
jgi:FAD/FMN-containing dehydrogenase